MRLTDKHRTAILMMVSGKNLNEISKAINVSQPAISQWKNDFDFNHELQIAFSHCYKDAINRIAKISTRAVDELEKIICDAETPMKFRLQAISIALNHGEKAINYQLEHRLEKLENLALNEVDNEIIDV